MLRFLCVAALGLLLGGCVSMQSVNDGIKSRYVGKSAEVAVSELGMPSREVYAAGRKAYVWEVGQDCTLQLELDGQERVAGSRLHGYLDVCRTFTR